MEVAKTPLPSYVFVLFCILTLVLCSVPCVLVLGFIFIRFLVSLFWPLSFVRFLVSLFRVLALVLCWFPSVLVLALFLSSAPCVLALALVLCSVPYDVLCFHFCFCLFSLPSGFYFV